MILPSLLLILSFLAADLVRPTHAVWFNLPSTGTKCVSEEIHNNVVVLADYVVISENYTHAPTVSVKVNSLCYLFPLDRSTLGFFNDLILFSFWICLVN